MSIIEPGHYQYVALDGLQVTDEGDMILHMRIRVGGQYVVLKHHLGPVPMTSEESARQICLEYLYLKFPPHLVEQFGTVPGIQWQKFFTQQQRQQQQQQQPESNEALFNGLNTLRLGEHFRNWAATEDLWHQ